MLQSVAVCRGVLQYVIVCCSVCCIGLICVAVSVTATCNVMQSVADLLQCVLYRVADVLQ